MLKGEKLSLEDKREGRKRLHVSHILQSRQMAVARGTQFCSAKASGALPSDASVTLKKHAVDPRPTGYADIFKVAGGARPDDTFIDVSSDTFP